MEENMKKKPTRLIAIFTWLAAALVVLLLLAAFYIAVVMGDPNQETAYIGLEGGVATSIPNQNVLAGQPARSIAAGEDITLLAASFPAPYLGLTGEGISLVGGQAYDSAFEGGFARIFVLTYQGEAGDQVQLTSIYPARAFDILGKNGYNKLSTDAYSLASQPAVRMDGEKGMRIHTQGEQALYAFAAPELTQDELGKLLKGVHLVQAP